MSPHSNLPPFPTYKPSRIEWLGDVPEHWQVRRLRVSTNYCVNGVWGNDPDGKDDLPCVRVADFDRHRLRVNRPIPTLRSIAPNERRRRMLQCGDLLLEKSGGGDQQPVGVVMLFDHEVDSVCSNFIARVSVQERFDSLFLTFLHAVLYSIGLNTRSIKQTTGIQNLDSAAYLNESVAFPPLPEQRAIARYLDYMDRRIQRYIKAKERLIELLEEQKRAVINQAVTRGLDPDVPLKPSGVEWLGDVPAHWEVRRLGTTVRDLQSGSWGDETDGSDDDIICVRVADFDRDSKRVDVGNLTVRSVDERARKKCRLLRGDLLIEKSGGGDARPVGTVVLFDRDIEAITSNFVSRMRVSEDHDHNYVNYVHSTLYDMRVNTLAIKQTTGIQNLDIKAYLNTKIALPPKFEQVWVAQMLDSSTSQTETSIVNALKQIELIQEYRTRLIADVVTGKLDVREAVAGLADDGGDEAETDRATTVDYAGTEA